MSGEFTSSENTRKGYIAGVTWKDIKEVTYAIVDGRAMLEGDIVLASEEAIFAAENKGAQMMASGDVFDSIPEIPERGMVVHGCIIVGAHYRWPNGVIPYTIDPTLPNQQRVTDAIEHWEQRTTIRLVERQTESDYVTFIPSNGCWSYVGRQGGQQHLGLASGCSTGNTIHEIGHAVGLWHEQSREDRDEHVTVHYENIMDSKAHNFDQHITDGDDVGRYDYGSLMHYPRTAFSKNGQDTITPPSGVSIGQRIGLSSGDVCAVGYMYGHRSWWQALLCWLKSVFGW